MPKSIFHCLVFLFCVAFFSMSAHADICKKPCHQNNVGDFCKSCRAQLDAGCYTEDILSKADQYLNLMGDKKVKSPLRQNVEKCKAQQAQKKNASAPSVKKTAPQSCKMEQDILNIEKAGVKVADAGERLKRIANIDMPTFPDVEMKLRAGGDDVKLQIVYQRNQADKMTVGDLALALTKITDAAKYLKEIVTAAPTQSDVWKYINTTLLQFTPKEAGLMALEETKDALIELKETQRLSKSRDVIAFVTNLTRTLDNVDHLRMGMICALKDGVPEFYADYQALKDLETKTLKKAADNPVCPATYRKVIKNKVKAANKHYRWVSEIVLNMLLLKTSHDSWVKHNTWPEKYIQGDGRLFAHKDCVAWRAQRGK